MKRKEESGVCHCGTEVDAHTWYDGHSPVDMGFPPTRFKRWQARRLEEARFLWDVVRTLVYSVFRGMW